LLQLREVLQRYPGGCKAYLHFHTESGVAAMIELSEGFRLKAGPALWRDVAALIGQAAVETRCTPVSGPIQKPNGGRTAYGSI
jgi:hypothetical protein